MSRRSVVTSVLIASVAVAAGCTGQIGDAAGSSGGGGAGTSYGTGGATGSGGSVPTVASDLPCDVATLLSSKCAFCHGPIPAPGSPMSLVTYANLTAPSKSDPTQTLAVAAISRMTNAGNPMPPTGLPAATTAEIAALQSWVSAGYPRTGCSSVTSVTTADAGTTPDPFAVAPTCTSGKTWTGGTKGSNLMEPGMACINCHASSRGEAPTFTIAGTIYPTAHEPDLCDGIVGTDGALVVVTDARGNSVSIVPNSVGNFYYSGALAAPFHAKVTYMGRERAMVAAQTSGDCNSCHTQSGLMSAPGRIILP